MALSESELASRALTDHYAPPRLGWKVWNWPRPQKYWAVAVLGLLGAILATTLLGRGERHSPGPLSAAHAAWEPNCDVCHGTSPPGVKSALCQSCHAGAPHHHRCQGHDGECATCHREHLGRDFSPLRVSDEHCTRCHQDLPAHTTDGGQWLVFAPMVRHFGAPPAHPEFQALRPSLAVEVGRTVALMHSPLGQGAFMAALSLVAGRTINADPGWLKFNHALHMTPGLVPTRGGRPFREALTYAGLPEPYQAAAGRGKLPNTPVQLECASCHERDAGDARAPLPPLPDGNRPAPATGAYLLPIVYERHCQACHPLTFEPGPPALQVPHRLQPAEVGRFLDHTYTEQYLRGDPKLLDRPLPVRPNQLPLPGQFPGPQAVMAREKIQAQVVAAERVLYAGATACGKCHHYEPADGPVRQRRIVPPQVPAVWFRHAVFSHTAHRALDCRACHANASPEALGGGPNRDASTRAADVLVPGISNCLQCHAPGSVTWRGARNDCVLCHRYHDGDAPLAGAGALARDPPRRQLLDVEGFKFHPHQGRDIAPGTP
ncbi:MAG TPA: cytochrome c3 family protein [Gemmataceae bacterium]|nr:cytochrome c3 family protein [Gemmataceae bacterium]